MRDCMDLRGYHPRAAVRVWPPTTDEGEVAIPFLPVKRFLVGTAGHIDHGKTALVKALTGIDADRLPEEKRRGITIDLGFAHAEWDGVRMSFVDVPGHERFVRNMLAGAGGIQAVLLVVAADESVMPQTREHFEIVRLLGIASGVIAITKCDRVAPELVEVTASDVRELARGSFLETAPIVPVSARTGEGLEALKAALVGLAQSVDVSASSGGDAGRREEVVRLPIDRAFLVAGFGPVVTGSLVSGRIRKDDRLEVLPDRRPVRVRRVEVHGREVDEARAGERVSVNLVGAELSDLRRGLVLATPSAFAISKRVVARMDLLPGSPRVKSGDRLSFHHFASESTAGVRILDGREISSGGSARVELRFARPIAAAPGDRFVVRRLSPVTTIGGGLVLDPRPSGFRAREEVARLQILDRLEKGSLPERLLVWIDEAREHGAEEDDLARRAGVGVEFVREALVAPLAERRIHAPKHSPDRYISGAALAHLAALATAELERLTAAGSGAVGVPRQTLLKKILPRADARWAEAVEGALAGRGALVLVGDEARPPGRSDLAGADRELSERIAAFFVRRGLDPPSPSEVVEAVRHRPKVVEGLIGHLVKTGTLVRLPGGWIVARDAVDAVLARLRARGKKPLDIAEFKEMFGLTRRLAIPLLEYLDGAKVTRRVGDRREIV
jgi:selenocysteine-specific elongation factor